MTTKNHALNILAILTFTCSAFAQEHHDKPIPGPNGGKIVEIENGHAEFLVKPDKKVSITFYDEDMTPEAPSGQVVTVIAEAPDGRKKLDFETAGEHLVSTTPLSDDDGYRVVLQIKSAADAKPQNVRIDYETEVCGKCERPEYACICDSGGHEGHDH